MYPLRIDPTDPRPIWRQIEEGVLHLVASGALAAATPVPSVRDLARELRVNPATVSKAYQRLTDAGVLAVRRGDGTYVADAPPALPVDTRRERLREAAVRYASLAATLGASADEVAAELAAAWQGLLRTRALAEPGPAARDTPAASTAPPSRGASASPSDPAAGTPQPRAPEPMKSGGGEA
jgi:GntR family transcriptional regulator